MARNRAKAGNCSGEISNSKCQPKRALSLSVLSAERSISYNSLPVLEKSTNKTIEKTMKKIAATTYLEF
jgi:hypothetical protein